jgi:hypothetical protein
MRKTLPLVITFVGGVVFAIQYFVPSKPSRELFNWWIDWCMAIAPFALLLGIFSLTTVHYHKAKRRAEHWPYSIITLCCLYGMIAIGLIGGRQGGVFKFLYNNVQVPIQATMFSLLAFYIASAAFRAFRARSVVATILLAAAVIVMLGRVPIGKNIGELITFYQTDGTWLAKVSEWILDYPNTASKRAINLGVGLGILSTSLKIILGIERSYLGGT